MKHFITGGAGFIGSNYAWHIIENTDDEVTIFDALTYAGNLSTIEPLIATKRVRFVRGDITNESSVTSAMRGHDFVVHFAAESHVDRSIKDPHIFVKTNCTGTSVVMNSALNVGVGRVIHVGTDEVYGSVEVGFSRETDPLDPRSPYSSTKAGSDLIALAYHTTYGLNVSVTRCTNNYGPYQYPEKAIPLFITNLIDGKKIPLYGNGLNVRDWIHVYDHCTGIFHVLNHGKSGEVYNIGSGNTLTNLSLVGMILVHMGAGGSMVEYVTDRQGHDKRYALDCTKLKKLGWEPQIDFDNGLQATIAWYMSNEKWWRGLNR